MNHTAIFFEGRKFDVKGESVDEERNQEGCKEEGRSEKEREVAASDRQLHYGFHRGPEFLGAFSL